MGTESGGEGIEKACRCAGKTMVCHSQFKKRETENKRKEHDEETDSIVSSSEGCFEVVFNEVFELGGVQ
jgi:hypothetical protein